MDIEYELDYNWLNYDPETGREVDTFDYEAAGLLSPDDCDGEQRLCCGCKFEFECFDFG